LSFATNSAHKVTPKSTRNIHNDQKPRLLALKLAQRRRLSVKPGLTCLWQISGRNNVKDFKDWVRLDLEYIDNWSLWLDLTILARTFPVVLTGLGAK